MGVVVFFLHDEKRTLKYPQNRYTNVLLNLEEFNNNKIIWNLLIIVVGI